jgi:hypothetical protein
MAQNGARLQRHNRDQKPLLRGTWALNGLHGVKAPLQLPSSSFYIQGYVMVWGIV